jgi:hypothetical protein
MDLDTPHPHPRAPSEVTVENSVANTAHKDKDGDNPGGWKAGGKETSDLGASKKVGGQTSRSQDTASPPFHSAPQSSSHQVTVMRQGRSRVGGKAVEEVIFYFQTPSPR